MGEKKKVLVVINELRRGGVEIAAMNFQLYLDREKYDCCYYIRKGDNKDEGMLNAILESGAAIIERPPYADNYLKEYKYFKKLFSEKRFDVVHAHQQSYNGFVMLAAYKNNIKKRVSHSHATKRNVRISRLKRFILDTYESVMRRVINRYATDIVACSEDAGKYLYGEKEFEKRGTVINNGIDFDNYTYTPERKMAVRERLGLSDEFVLGHVGTVYWLKNQEFIIKIFSEILKSRKNAVLLLVGEVIDGGKCEELAKRLGIGDRVRFFGVRNDIPDLMCAMDAFVFPSLCEALPMAPVEAQAAQLPCLISDRVVRYLRHNINTDFADVSDTPAEWAEKILILCSLAERSEVSITKLAEQYDIKKIAKELERIYEN